MSGQEEKRGEGEGEAKSEGLGPIGNRTIVATLIDDIIGGDDDVVAQRARARRWYAFANDLATKALANPDRRNAEPDRPGGRRDEET